MPVGFQPLQERSSPVVAWQKSHRSLDHGINQGETYLHADFAAESFLFSTLAQNPAGSSL